MKPSHSSSSFTAERIFTDREDATDLFRRAFDGSQSADDYRILAWHGVGGQGKSALSREMMRIAGEIADATSDVRIGRARINLEYPRMRQPGDALLSARLQLGRAFGARFPCFDTAFARLHALLNPGIDIRQRHPELFKGDNALLEGLSEIGGAVAGEVPGLGLLFKYGKRFTVTTQEWFETRGKHVLKGLDQLDHDNIADTLPRYLGADLCDLRTAYPDSRIVIAIDTYEALWRDYNTKDMVDGAHADAWVRSLVQDAPGVLFLIFGRDKLRWDEINRDWETVVESHRLGPLSDPDADLFLRRVPIEEADIREKIVETSAGLPFYLDLQVSHYANLREGGPPSVDDFATQTEGILPRFWNHLSDPEREIVRYASYPHDLSETVMNSLSERFPGPLGQMNWGLLKRQSFMSEAPDGDPVMHDLMRSMVQSREQEERPEQFKSVHLALFEIYDADAQPAAISAVTQSHELAFEAALHHKLQADQGGLLAWFEPRMKTFRNAHRSRLLERMCRFVYKTLKVADGDEHPDTLAARHALAEQIGRQGRYGEAEAEFRAIWETIRRDDVLGPEHPDTLTARASLAKQIGNQGRHGEAEAEFRVVWEIMRRDDVLGPEHPGTLTVRSYFAQQISHQGRYGEAEAEFRAIVEIQRRDDVLGPEHPGTLNVRNNLAGEIGHQGRYGEAEAEFRAVWEIMRRDDVLGEEHPDTLAARQNLALQIGKQWRHSEAEVEFRTIWEIQRRDDVLGPEHPGTLTVRNNLAVEIGHQGRYGEAEAEFREIWEVQRRDDVLGEEHPGTLTTRSNLALQIGFQGRFDEAETEFREIWEVQRRDDVLGEEHPGTLTTRNNLASVIGKQGRHDEAEQEFRAIWNIRHREEVLGPEHLNTLASRYDLAQQIGNQGRHGEAEAEFRAVWEVMRRSDVLGPEHLKTLNVHANLAVEIGRQGRHAEAEAEFRVVWEIMRRDDVLGPEHPDTLNTRNSVALEIGSQGRHAEAEAEFRAVWEIQHRDDVLGPDHPHVARSAFWIAKMLDLQGDQAQAEEWLDGLEQRYLRTLHKNHEWVAELKKYISDRST